MSTLNPSSGLRPAAVPGALDTRAAAVMTTLCLTWALQQVSLKAAAPFISPVLMVALRSLLALALLGLLMQRRGEGLQRRNARAGALVGSLFALEFLLVAEALRLAPASHVIVFLYTAPLFAALGLHLRLPAERLARGQWVGIALAFGGLVVAFAGTGHGDATARAGVIAGDALALLAGVAWGATTVAIRCSALAQAPATETLMFQLIGAVAWLLPAAWLTGQWPITPSAALWAHLGFQALVVSLASFLAWFWLLRHYLASRLGVFSFLTPLFGVVLGVGLLGEPLEPGFVAGSAAVLAGIALVSGHAALARGVAWLGRRRQAA